METRSSGAGEGAGGGIPLSAVVGPTDVIDAIPGSQATTTGGSVLGAAAANVTLDILGEGLVERADEMGTHLETRMQDSLADQALVGDVRGRGMLFGIEIEDTDEQPDQRVARSICHAAWQEGVLVRAFGICGNVVVVAPPLTIEDHELDLGLERLFRAIERVASGDTEDGAC